MWVIGNSTLEISPFDDKICAESVADKKRNIRNLNIMFSSNTDYLTIYAYAFRHYTKKSYHFWRIRRCVGRIVKQQYE